MTSIQDFFARHGLTEEDVKTCLDLISFRYGNQTIAPVAEQGGCSFTAIVGSAGKKTILQLRPIDFAIDITIAHYAERIFPNLAPKLIRCDFLALSSVIQIVEMSVVKGTKFSNIMCGNRQDEVWKLKNLLGGMAEFFATSWYAAAEDNNNRKGLIGSSILKRLALLETDLPSIELQRIAHDARRSFEQGVLDVLPVVLNHGDLLPCNVMVDEASGHLVGLVDWAEAEYLPFGMTLYGIEHMLGYMDEQERFVYYGQADVLRDFFWHHLREKIGVLREVEVWEAVLLSRRIGQLLWHGYAWDEGRRDRVVDAHNDWGELSCLEQMLGVSSQPRQVRL